MKNKGLVCGLGFLVITSLAGLACGQANVGESPQPTPYPPSQPSPSGDLVNIFLCGDVMTGRGIDQILPHAGNPFLYEPFVRSAQDYVELAERAHGPIPRPVDFAYIWGDALAEFDRLAPDVKIINLETSITQSDDYWADKGIHYRMHPENIPCLTAAGINCCALANNHVLDWGYAGLVETLETLEKANIESAGAGRNLQEAEEPAVIEVAGRGRVLVFSYGTPSSGIPLSWAASETMPGVNLLRDLSAESLQWVKRQVDKVKRESDIVVCSIHWGSNWGYEIPIEHVRFAHGLIDEAGVDVIHGHSSHHVKGIEVYKGKPILYGCGDLINDYEGIGGYGEFRPDLALMYFLYLEPKSGRLAYLRMTPIQVRRMRANRASKADALWLRDTLSMEGDKFGTWVEMAPDDTLALRWD